MPVDLKEQMLRELGRSSTNGKAKPVEGGDVDLKTEMLNELKKKEDGYGDGERSGIPPPETLRPISFRKPAGKFITAVKPQEPVNPQELAESMKRHRENVFNEKVAKKAKTYNEAIDFVKKDLDAVIPQGTVDLSKFGVPNPQKFKEDILSGTDNNAYGMNAASYLNERKKQLTQKRDELLNNIDLLAAGGSQTTPEENKRIEDYQNEIAQIKDYTEKFDEYAKALYAPQVIKNTPPPKDSSPEAMKDYLRDLGIAASAIYNPVGASNKTKKVKDGIDAVRNQQKVQRENYNASMEGLQTLQSVLDTRLGLGNISREDYNEQSRKIYDEYGKLFDYYPETKREAEFQALGQLLDEQRAERDKKIKTNFRGTSSIMPLWEKLVRYGYSEKEIREVAKNHPEFTEEQITDYINNKSDIPGTSAFGNFANKTVGEIYSEVAYPARMLLSSQYGRLPTEEEREYQKHVLNRQFQIGNNELFDPPETIRDTHPTIKGEYDKETVNPSKYETQLSAEQEGKFSTWLDNNYKEGKIAKGDYDFYKEHGYGYDYDFRAAFEKGIKPEINKQDGKYHWSDIGKKPNHTTFSKESIYNNADGFVGGEWKDGEFKPNLIDIPNPNYLQGVNNPAYGHHNWGFGALNIFGDAVAGLHNFALISKFTGMGAGAVFGRLIGAETSAATKLVGMGTVAETLEGVPLAATKLNSLEKIRKFSQGQEHLSGNFLGISLTDYARNKEAAAQFIDDEHGGEPARQAWAATNAMATGFIFGMGISPASLFTKALGLEAKQQEAKLFADMIPKNGIEGVTKEKWADYFKNHLITQITKSTASETLKATAILAVPQAVAFGTQAMFNPQSVEGRNFGQELVDDAVRNYITFAPISLFGAVVGQLKNPHKSQSQVEQEAIYYQSGDPYGYREYVNQQVEDGKLAWSDANKRIQMVNTMAVLRNNLVPPHLSKSEQIEYANNLMHSYYLEQDVKNTEVKLPPEQIAIKNKQIKELEERREEILAKTTGQEKDADGNPIIKIIKNEKRKTTTDSKIATGETSITEATETTEAENKKIKLSEQETRSQALSAPNAMVKQVGEEKTIELIASHTPEEINNSIKDFQDLISEDKISAEDADKHISLLEKGLEKSQPKEKPTAAEHAENIKTKFREKFKGKGVEDKHIEGALALMDTRAKVWAGEKKGRTPDEWYERIADVKTGEFESDSKQVLFQILDDVDVFNIYQSLKGSPIEKTITPEIKEIFDRLLTEKKEAIAEKPKEKEKETKPTLANKVKAKLEAFKQRRNLAKHEAAAEHTTEDNLANRNLRTGDNIKQEPVIKALEDKTKSVEGVESKELDDINRQVDQIIGKATGVVNVPIKDISTNPTEYQGRKNKFSERSAKNVAENFDPNRFDPIVLFKHPDGKTYVISGHSRLEGMKRRGAETIPARYFEGTAEQAKDFAQKSNKFGTLQTDIENAAYYRDKLKKGASYDAVLKEAKENEQEGSAKRIVSIAHLNPNGRTMSALDALGGESDSKNNIVNVAQKIGDIRARNEHLTDAHENELLDFMLADKGNIPTDKTIADQNSAINRSVAAVKFDPKEPLNLAKHIPKTAERIEWENTKRDLEDEQSKLRQQVNPSKKTGWTGLKERAIATLAKGDKSTGAIEQARQDFEANKDGVKDAYQNLLDKKKAELRSVSDKLAVHLLKEKDLIKGEKGQGNLFEEPQTYYGIEDTGGKQLEIPYQSYATDDYPTAATNLQQQGGENASTAHPTIASVWRKLKDIQFSGKTRVKSHKDVAHIMRLLESKETEHGFAVHVDKNGKVNIQLLSIGGRTHSVIDPLHVLAGAKKFKAVKTYLVHNHPSGNLEPSQADLQITARIAEGMHHHGVKIAHIIMDTWKGEYTVLSTDVSKTATYVNTYPRDLKQKAHRKHNLYHFDAAQPLTEPQSKKIYTPLDTVLAIQRFTYSAFPKRGVLILNRANDVLSSHVIEKYTDAAELVANTPSATNVIFFSNEHNIQEVKDLQHHFALLGIKVLDYVTSNSSGADIVGAYRSASREGLLSDIQQKYGTNSVGEPKPGEGKEPDVYDHQDKNAEKIISKHWNGNGGNVWRFKFENAGDILRELSKYKNTFLDPGYIFEKVNYIRDFIKKWGFNDNNVHPDDSYRTLQKENAENIAALKKAYQEQPVMSEAQEQARQLALNLIDGNLREAQKNLDYFEKFRGKGREAIMQANEYRKTAFAVKEQEPLPQDLTEMTAIVKDLVKGGTTKLADIQNEVADYLGDDSPEMKDLVARAYHEYGKRPKLQGIPNQIVHGVMGQVSKWLTKTFGGRAQEKVVVMTDHKSLMAKAKELMGQGKPVQYDIKDSNGNTITVQKLPEGTHVINGFYSPIEKSLREFKGETKSAKAWLDHLGKGDEITFTGLRELLESKKPNEQIKKQELLDYMNDPDNRISIVEVVRSDDAKEATGEWEEYTTSPLVNTPGTEEMEEGGKGLKRVVGKALFYGSPYNDLVMRIVPIKGGETKGFLAIEPTGRTHKFATIEEAKELLDNLLPTYQRAVNPTKYPGEAHNLPGDKRNYKEVLITLPKKVKQADYDREAELLDQIRNINNKIYALEENQPNFNPSKEDLAMRYDLWDERDKAQKELNDLRKKIGGETDKEFVSTHWDNEPNILAHLRMDVRTDADGKRTLFLQEVQSDWAQLGRRQGFRRTPEERKKAILETPGIKFVKNGNYYTVYHGDVPLESQAKLDGYPVIFNVPVESFDNANRGTLSDIERALGTYKHSSDISKAPFVTNTGEWVKLSMKVALQHAIKLGADRISWTTGEQQNERYSLSKLVKWIDVNEAKALQHPYATGERDMLYVDISTDDRLYTVKIDGRIDKGKILESSNAAPPDWKGKNLEEVVGKEMAERIIDAPHNTRFEGEGLEVGGKGMKEFYGSPQERNKGIVGKVAESLGGKVTTTEMEIHGQEADKESDFSISKLQDGMWLAYYNDSHLALARTETREEAQQAIKDHVKAGEAQKSLQHNIEITPKMRAEVERGLPMFQVTLPGGEKVNAQPLPEGTEVVNGFYSPIEKSVRELKVDNKSASGWISHLGKGDEITFTGLRKFLEEKKPNEQVKKSEILDYLKNNRIQILEFVNNVPKGRMQELQDKVAALQQEIIDTPEQADVTEIKKKIEKLRTNDLLPSLLQNKIFPNPQVIEPLYSQLNELYNKYYHENYEQQRQANEELDRLYAQQSTPHSYYQVEGRASGYKEVLITMPNASSIGEAFETSHFPGILNIIAHIRMNIRESEGKKTLFVEEFQSDWGEQGRDKGFDNKPQPVPEATIAEKREVKKRLDDSHTEYLKLSNLADYLYGFGVTQGQQKVLSETSEANRIRIIDKIYKARLAEIDESRRLEQEDNQHHELDGFFEEQERAAKSRYNNALENAKTRIDFEQYQNDTRRWSEITGMETASKKPVIRSAPFVTNTDAWVKLAFRTALRHAVEEGVEKIAWTTGEQQNERWQYLEKKVDSITYIKQHTGDWLLEFYSDSGSKVSSEVMKENKIKLWVGDEIARKIINNEGYDPEGGRNFVNRKIGKVVIQKGEFGGHLFKKDLGGKELTIGDKPMKEFYGSPSERAKANRLEIKKNGDEWVVTGVKDVNGNTVTHEFKNENEAIRFKENYGLGVVGRIAKSMFGEVKDSKIKTLNVAGYDFDSSKPLETKNQSANWEINKVGDHYHVYRDGDIYAGADYEIKTREEAQVYIDQAKGEVTQHSVDITPEMEAEVNKGLPLFMKDKGGNILGFSHDGKIYLNGKTLNPNTPLHEAGHIWTEWVKQNDTKVYDRGIELVKDSNYLKRAKENKFYKGEAEKLPEAEREKYFQHEALAMAIGDKGAQFVTEGRRKTFKEWIKSVWDAIKTAVGFKDVTAEELQDMTFDEFTKRAARDILAGDEKFPEDEGKPEELKAEGEDMGTGAGGGEGTGGGGTGTEPPPEGEFEPNDNQRKFTKRMLADETILPKEQIAKTLDYVRQTNDMSKEEASRIIDEIGVDEAFELISHDSDLKAAVRVTIGQMLIKKFNTLAGDTKNDLETRNYYWDKTVEAATFVTERLGTEAGQQVQAFRMWGELSAEAQMRNTIKEVKKAAEKRANKRKEDIEKIGKAFRKANEETVDELEKSPRVRKAIERVKAKKPKDEDARIAAGLKELEKAVGAIIRKHFLVTGEQKKSLIKKFIDDLGLSPEDAEQLSKEIETEFDNIATRKKLDIIDQMKRTFERIRKRMEGKNKTDRKSFQDEVIKYTNLGAFDDADLKDIIVKKLGLGDASPENLKEIERLAMKIQNAPEGDPKDQATIDLLNYKANMKGMNWMEIAQGIWYSNILSGYLTHIKNIVSTAFNSIAQLVIQTGKDPLSLPFLLYGGAKGVKRGLIEGLRTITTGRSTIRVGKIEVPNVLERIQFKGGLLNPANYFKFVGRLMIAEDVLQFQGLKEMRATQLAYREAKRLGYRNPFDKRVWKIVNEKLLNTPERVEDAKEQIEDEGLTGNAAKRRMYELIEQSRPIPMTEDAYGFAAKGTFNHDTEGTLGALNNLVSQVLDLNIGGSRPLRYFVPFTRILTNVANNALDYSPVGIYRYARKKRGFESFEDYRLTKDQYHEMTKEERQDTLIKASLGIMSMAALYALSGKGGQIQITGAGTSDLEKNKQLLLEGWQPYSIKIGDKYYSYKLTPLVFAWGLVGSMRDHEQYDKADDVSFLKRMQLASWDGVKNLSDMTWVGSTSDLMQSLNANNPEQGIKAFTGELKNMGKSFVIPNAYTQSAQRLEQFFNIPQKQVDNMYQNMIQDIPIARNSLHDKVNALGDPIVRDIDILISKENQDPVWKYLLDKKGWVAPVKKQTLMVYDDETEMDRPATDDEYFEFSKKRGQIIKAAIQDIIANGDWVIEKDGRSAHKEADELTPKQLNEILTPIETQATKDVKAEMFNQ